jgi:hypothetical protein
MREAVLLCDYELLKILRHRELRGKQLIGVSFIPLFLRWHAEKIGTETLADQKLFSVLSVPPW